MSSIRERMKEKKRIVVKIGSSSLMHDNTGKLNLLKIEKLVRILVDIKNSGKDVILVSSGAIAVGRNAIGLHDRPDDLSVKQACAAIGQAKLMMVYQKIFSEYNSLAAQVLLTKTIVLNPVSRQNAENTFRELSKLGAIPVVNENDTISTSEIEQVQTFGDNDRLSAVVASITDADLLILLSDIDGMYTDDPRTNPDARFIHYVETIDDSLINIGAVISGRYEIIEKVGTGGMASKIAAAMIAANSGADMVITNANNVENIVGILNGEDIGTLFLNHRNKDFDLKELI